MAHSSRQTRRSFFVYLPVGLFFAARQLSRSSAPLHPAANSIETLR
jgi:hypothetical protein